MQCYSSFLRPQSDGNVRITSPDPSAPLAIDANYLAHERDRAGAVAGTALFVGSLANRP